MYRIVPKHKVYGAVKSLWQLVERWQRVLCVPYHHRTHKEKLQQMTCILARAGMSKTKPNSTPLCPSKVKVMVHIQPYWGDRRQATVALSYCTGERGLISDPGFSDALACG